MVDQGVIKNHSGQRTTAYFCKEGLACVWRSHGKCAVVRCAFALDGRVRLTIDAASWSW